MPIFSQILEKLMHKKLTSFLDRYNILYKHQYGFQRGKSTDYAILDLHTNIIKEVENREKSCSIFLDFAKTFDKVNHENLLKKSKYYGIRGLPLNWFKSYLLGRYHCVKTLAYSNQKNPARKWKLRLIFLFITLQTG